MDNRKDEQYSEQETAQRRDAAIKRMLNTPPKPHSEMKIGKPKGRKSKSPRHRKAVKKSAL
jgi:hypothetical protein